ncbi:MAG: hypothetical protein NXH75_07300 [Halobacteriovoraceae bacterium]|nr:hypothetical protein [Halobacteriovoraceae bacterium]
MFKTQTFSLVLALFLFSVQSSAYLCENYVDGGDYILGSGPIKKSFKKSEGLKEDYPLFYDQLDKEMNDKLLELCMDKESSPNDVWMSLNTECNIGCYEKAPAYQYKLFLSKVIKANLYRNIDRHIQECRYVCDTVKSE